ncbi:MAG: hypothetical protein ABIQ60_14585 [Burkholderiaceae bacterium]
MIDRICFTALTFGLLLAGTLVIGSALFGWDSRTSAPSAHVRVVQLEPVVIVGKRLAPRAAVATNNSTEPEVQRVQ